MSFDGVPNYPLCWPLQVPRTKVRTRAPFGVKRGPERWSGRERLSLSQGLDRLEGELRRMGAKTITISTDVEPRLDGRARSGLAEPTDPGVAVYFRLRDRPYCFPCDRWDRVADNVAAVAKHIEALRGQDRWGVGSVEQAFAGYLALPAPGTDWRALLGNPVSLDDAKTAFKQHVREAHPDVGGDAETMMRLKEAMLHAERFFEKGGNA